jgi:hypothetical protein
VAALKRGLESEEGVFRKQSNDSPSALRASYRVAHLLAEECKHFRNGGIRKKIFTAHSER